MPVTPPAVPIVNLVPLVSRNCTVPLASIASVPTLFALLFNVTLPAEVEDEGGRACYRTSTFTAAYNGPMRRAACTVIAVVAFGFATEAQTPLGRIGQPEDIAPAAVFFASSDSAWITGETLTISGGLR